MTAQDALASHRLTRAREALAEADLLISANRRNGALNRAYYAAFYAARALLALKRIDSSRHTAASSRCFRSILSRQEPCPRTSPAHCRRRSPGDNAATTATSPKQR